MFLLGAAGLLGFLGLWWGLSASGLVAKQFLPTPLEVLARTLYLLTEPFAGATLPEHLARSFERYAYGFMLAAAVGVPLGLLMGWFRWLDDMVTPVFDGLRFIAPIAWVPFAALWFGTGIGGPIMIIFSGAFPPCLINAYRGARFVDRIAQAVLATLSFHSPFAFSGRAPLHASRPSSIIVVSLSCGNASRDGGNAGRDRRIR